MSTRLTDEQVREIRTAFQAGKSQRELAESYGIKQNTVSSIVTGRNRLSAGGPISRASAAKLTEADVIALRTEAAAGVPHRDLSKKYGVSVQMVSNVTTGRAFADVAGPRAEKRPARAKRLSAAQVDEILQRSSAGESRAMLAAAFDVSVWTIDSVRRGTTRGADGGADVTFTADDVQTMRERYQQGATQTELAADFDTSQQMVSNIVRGIMYASAGGPIADSSSRRFTVDQIRQIRDAARTGADVRSLAEQYDSTEAIIRQIIDEVTYPTPQGT